MKDYVSEEEARTNPHKPDDRTFGLCLLDIVVIRKATGGMAGVRYKPTTPFLGHAHAQIYGCEDAKIQQQLVLLATVVPAPEWRPRT